jgi:hypothetical protein
MILMCRWEIWMLQSTWEYQIRCAVFGNRLKLIAASWAWSAGINLQVIYLIESN